MTMRIHIIPACLLICCIATGIAHGQEKTVEVDPCALEKNPGQYDHLLITVHSHLTLGFEDFSLAPENCPGGRENGWVWLELGGDSGPATIYCCGDHTRPKGMDVKVDGISIPLQQNVFLEQMMRLLSVSRHKTPAGRPCYKCKYFRVSATFTGRFFAGQRMEFKEGHPFYGGYGHMGCCSLLVIQEVSNVTAERTKIPIGGKFSCTRKTWRWPQTGTPEQIAEQRAAKSGEEDWRVDDMERVAVAAIRSKTSEWKDERSLEIYESGFPGDPYRVEAHGHWESEDRLIGYAVKLKKSKALLPYAKDWDNVIWLPYELTQDVCTPRN